MYLVLCNRITIIMQSGKELYLIIVCITSLEVPQEGKLVL